MLVAVSVPGPPVHLPPLRPDRSTFLCVPPLMIPLRKYTVMSYNREVLSTTRRQLQVDRQVGSTDISGASHRVRLEGLHAWS